jgi:hypothetical protein
MHMTPFDDVGAAVTAAVDRAGRDARVLVIPHGSRVTACRGPRQDRSTG